MATLREKADKALYKLDEVEHALTDLKTIVKWSAEHSVALGEIVELLTNYDYFQEVVGDRYDNDFEAFEQFICDSITEFKENM